MIPGLCHPRALLLDDHRVPHITVAFTVKEKQYSSKYQELRPAAAPSGGD